MSEVARLPKTEGALYAVMTDARNGFGEHFNDWQATGQVDVQYAAMPYDPSIHDGEDVDWTLTEAQMFDRPYVSTGIIHRPETIHVIEDQMQQSTGGVIYPQKKHASEQLVEALMGAAPTGDAVEDMVVTDELVQRHDFGNVVRVKSQEDGISHIEGVALDGLALIVSDFNRTNFKPGSLQGALAIKVSQTVELGNMPVGNRPIQLGNGVVLDTRNKKQVKNFNEQAVYQHGKTVDDLQRIAGANVVTVAANSWNEPYGFDVTTVDPAIAQKIIQLRR